MVWNYLLCRLSVYCQSRSLKPWNSSFRFSAFIAYIANNHVSESQALSWAFGFFRWLKCLSQSWEGRALWKDVDLHEHFTLSSSLYNSDTSLRQNCQYESSKNRSNVWIFQTQNMNGLKMFPHMTMTRL